MKLFLLTETICFFKFVGLHVFFSDCVFTFFDFGFGGNGDFLLRGGFVAVVFVLS